MFTITYSKILEQQRSWAAKHKIAVDDDGYTKALNDNLFQPLHPDTLREFQRGSGDELGKERRRGKMRALHSSSALAVNVFDYWRGRSLNWFATVLSLSTEPSFRGFEAQFATGLQGTPPNLDLAFVVGSGQIAAVESKFTELYCHTKQTTPFTPAYFPSGNGLWADRSLPRCQRLAERLDKGELQFHFLNAAQLLKHILGLSHDSMRRFTLLYLWYSIPSDEARTHEDEIKTFSNEIGLEVDFRALTYQELFSATLRNLGAEHEAYVTYLAGRYFPASRT